MKVSRKRRKKNYSTPRSDLKITYAISGEVVALLQFPKTIASAQRFASTLYTKNSNEAYINMIDTEFIIRNASEEEYDEVGQLMVNVYSQLKDFPGPEEQPDYYQFLSNVGRLIQKPGIEMLVAVSHSGAIYGAVVYFSDMQYYGSGGIATQEKNTSGFRLLAVDKRARGLGVGKRLTEICIEKAKSKQHKQVIIHTTKAMQTAWLMYEQLGFRRSEDLDFMQGELGVFGFRLNLQTDLFNDSKV